MVQSLVVEGPWFRQLRAILGHSPHLLASVAADAAYSIVRNLQVSHYVMSAKLESHSAKLASFAPWNMLCVCLTVEGPWFRQLRAHSTPAGKCRNGCCVLNGAKLASFALCDECET